MVRAYSQRLLPPFSGVVQIAESECARAQSFDGVNWEIQFIPGTAAGNGIERVMGYAQDRGYYNVAHVNKGELKVFMRFPAFLDKDQVNDSIRELHEFLQTAEVPFPSADLFEYWLLDESDQSPLALLYACCDESLMDNYPGYAEWTALPHSKMDVDNTDAEDAQNEPPVNHRLQRMVARRAGSSPRAAWFNRSETGQASFPSLLVREDWPEEQEHDVCQRYLLRKSPRLLMLHGLSHDDRERMEVAAKSHVFEVEQYFTMYPEINDERRMKAMRVEAQLRRTAPKVSDTSKKKKAPVDTGLGKDMRIFET